MDWLRFWTSVKWISIAIGIGGIVLPLAYRAGWRIYQDFYNQWLAQRRDKLTLGHIADQNKLHQVRVIRPDENGRHGIALDTAGVYRNMDTGEVFTHLATLYFDPMRAQMDAIQRTLLAMRGVQGGATSKIPGLIESAPAPGQWPTTVNLSGLLASRPVSIHNLIVGITIVQDGTRQVISASLHELMHTLLVGVTGKGKSMWLSSLLWQLAQASEPVEVLAIDISGSEFNILHKWDRLRYPVARTTEDAITLMTQAVQPEIARRRAMYEQHPLATKLDEYNKATGANMPPWVIVIDEGTSLLNQKGLSEPLREAVQTARQYGIYILLAGQTAHHRVIDTQTRDNFPTRLCYRTSPTSARVVLGGNPPGELVNAPGRAWAQLNSGDETIQILGPFVDRTAFYELLQNDGPKHPMPRPDTRHSASSNDQDLDRRVRLEWEALEDPNVTAITRRLFDGQDGGRNWLRVKASLERQGLI